MLAPIEEKLVGRARPQAVPRLPPTRRTQLREALWSTPERLPHPQALKDTKCVSLDTIGGRAVFINAQGERAEARARRLAVIQAALQEKQTDFDPKSKEKTDLSHQEAFRQETRARRMMEIQRGLGQREAHDRSSSQGQIGSHLPGDRIV